MRVLALFAAVLLAVVSLLPAVAQARSVTIRVHVETGSSNSQPVTGAEVEILDQDGNPLGSGVTDATGSVEIKIELPEGAGELVIGVDQPSGGANGYSGLDAQHLRDYFSADFYTGLSPAGELMLPVLVKRAIAKCDQAEYDRWVAELDSLVASLERDLATEQAAADKFARDNNLRVTDLKGARKDLDRARKAQAKLDPSLRDPAMLQTLEDYVEQLDTIEAIKRELAAARKARQEVPPFPKDCQKKKEVGMGTTPGQCPDGSGGLLAGALNDIFDSDLKAACADPSQHRDTERPRKNKEDRRERRD